jgi:hypothetical protein
MLDMVASELLPKNMSERTEIYIKHRNGRSDSFIPRTENHEITMVNMRISGKGLLKGIKSER